MPAVDGCNHVVRVLVWSPRSGGERGEELEAGARPPRCITHAMCATSPSP